MRSVVTQPCRMSDHAKAALGSRTAGGVGLEVRVANDMCEGWGS